MQAETESSSLVPFQEWLDRIARPIEFASRDDGAHLKAITNLSDFISTQVLSALRRQTYSRAIEARLISLRDLFVDFSSSLSPDEQRRRLHAAGLHIQALRKAVQKPAAAAQTLPTGSVHEAVSTDGGRTELWRIPVRFAKGVGPKRTAVLQRLRIETIEDVLWSIPWRYEDRSVMTPIGNLVPGMVASICGIVGKCEAKRARNRRLSVLEVGIEDQSGRLQVVFFNQPYLEDILTVGTRVMLSGRVISGRGDWMVPRMDVAQCEVVGEGVESALHVGRIVPVYHETKGWTSRQMRVLVRNLLADHGMDLIDHLPVPLRARQRLIPIHEAFQDVHFPKAGTDGHLLERGKTAAHRRLAFEELLLLQLALASRHRSVYEERKEVRFNPKTPLLAQLVSLLPFRLTAAQERVIREIFRDMISPRPMNRLVQGDVGSGKTAVALQAIVMACGSGYQAALLAPTEILAEQHYRNLSGMLQALGLQAVLVRGGEKASVKNVQVEQLASGDVNVAIGTHALLQQGITFKNLGLAVIDEQHKFGVLQRKAMIEKGYRPDVLVLTATPIPRTLAMTAYGDLDVSVIDALPPGRKPVRTFLFSEGQRRKAYQIVRDELRADKQAYIVYPLVEESEKVDLQAAIQGAEQLKNGEFSDFRVGLLHGRMKAVEKEAVMADFKSGTIQLLIATTVIEVGVDVPNATVILIEHAERFGLAQLHQLRGRVGRSSHQAYCLLMAQNLGRRKTESRRRTLGSDESMSAAGERLEALVRSNDGFVIAEDDLRIRGPGEFFGLRQWGMPEFRVANLVRDGDLLEQARQEAFSLLQSDPGLKESAHQGLREAMLRKWEKKLELGSIS
ncbi:MAG: ATP-dependent DNA helicase RecG [Nitrospira sp.]|nr:ATP-dependent DNA helicase RecG [Nitrospira sp.]